ncbi:glycosyltransferase family 4 protein [Nesterenkonia alba]|uniref:glycosyltransferase family 4 protein n=1 Tax=Nesterenkonia alba TaxID=515814 RepID=UPI0003B649AE|nr:glycosyltransferase family 4 protein [Nesterenkonia alba]
MAHYREPLVRRLQASQRIAVDLVGRFNNAEATASERIASASEDVLSAVEPLRTLRVGLWWWQRGDVAAVWRGGYDAYVLEGRFYTLSAWAAALAGRIRGRRVLLWGHGWKRPESGIKRHIRLCFYRLVDGLLVYGDRACQLGLAYGVPPEKLAVVYNSLYPEHVLPRQPVNLARRRRGATEGATLIYSSRLTTRHRLDTLAEALRHWPSGSPTPRVVVVGDGVERPRLERVFAEAGLEAQFLGAVYDTDRLRDLYAHADLAVSIGGAGLNVIQALSFGIPVVAEAGHPDSSPEIEAVIEGETGSYYDDAASLRELLIQLLSDPEELYRMGSRGLELIRSRYTAERHAEAIEEALLVFTGADE